MKKIDYIEYVEGPTIIFIPGSFSTASAWSAIQKLMPPNYPFIGTSLCGYGSIEELRSTDNYRMHNLIYIIETVVAKNGQPVHLVGYSFGGMVALASALSRRLQILSIPTFEANPITLIDAVEHRHLFEETIKIKHEFEAAFNAQNKAAARIKIYFWGGDGSFDSMPNSMQQYCRQTAYNNVLDWYTALSFRAKADD